VNIFVGNLAFSATDHALRQLFEPYGVVGFDHGVGHSLLLLYDAKAPLGKNSNYFNDLCHDLSNPSIGLF